METPPTTTSKQKSRKKRVQPVRRKVRQLDWLMQWFTAMFPCAICTKPLSEGYDKRNPGKSVTLHHTEGSREEDRWDDPEYVAKMVPCHVSCHRSYHLSKRHLEEGKKVPEGKVAGMEKNIAAFLAVMGLVKGFRNDSRE